MVVLLFQPYSSPKHAIKREYYIIFFNLDNRRKVYNMSDICRSLEIKIDSTQGAWTTQAIETGKAMKLAILSTGEPILSDNKNIPDLLDFGIIRIIPKNYYQTEPCLELFSDHSPVIFKINSKIMTKGKPCTLCNAKTK